MSFTINLSPVIILCLIPILTQVLLTKPHGRSLTHSVKVTRGVKQTASAASFPC